MDNFLNRFLDSTSDFLAERPGLLPLLAVVLIFFNFLLQIFPGSGYWLVESNLFLHLGLIVGFLGLLLIRPLE
ncbi:MAG: hypothetical protein L0332_15570 [Chloroflexi bacterium]|nr:hypothetical protein [Chloroflexota bacterium]MCI0577319.1 hypothetical protein [Chloroflexota bacterium]MCI0646820.1 hypothetical protein [Chloroflexota bacterium]MCI0728122.1 hypothetical protein [Chloroflexota bacterium]